MVVCLLGIVAAAGPTGAGGAERATTATASARAQVDVVQITGLIDPVEADFLRHAVNGAEAGRASVLIVQLDSSSGVISKGRIDALSSVISHSPVPVAVWVGPNGARAYGAAFAILRAAALRGMAPGTRVGRPPAPAASGDPDPLAGTTISDGQALARHVVTISAPTLGDFLVSLDGQPAGPGAPSAPGAAGGQPAVLHTADVVRGANGEPRRQPSVNARFEKLSLQAQLLHTAASPPVAYLLLVIGLLLVILEFFTAGIGIAALCGAGCLTLASYGFGVLPFRAYALALIALGIGGFAVDLQAGAPRVWTVIGTAAIAIGTVRLFRGVQLSVLAMVAGVIGTALFMIGGMPAMVRARFSTPTIGRQSMIGEMGTALAAIEPEGTVEVRGAPWLARTNRATPIAPGARIRVVAIDGLLLEVEPETGGARDARH
jgi:membrane-bound serine protease (ClpP class)